MKKNRMMRIASVLLLAVLFSTCAISGTFAKYVSESTVSASAVVAKWDIKVAGESITAADPATTFDLADTWEDTRTETRTDDYVTAGLIAPGTKGSFSFVIKNDSDVVASYSIALTEALSATPSGYTDAQFPVEYSIDGSTWNSDITTLVPSGTLAIGGEATVTVQWRWTFSDTDNALDTAFGVTAPTVTVGAEITVEQVD